MWSPQQVPHSIVLDALTLSTLEQCDRTMSTVARDALQEIVWRHGDRVVLRHDCVLAKGADILAGSQLAKQRLSISLWKCGVCGKMFESEHFLDKHLARHHPRLHSGGSICLADLCGVVVPCRSHAGLPPSVSTKSLGGAEVQRKQHVASPCSDEEEFRTRRSACVHVVKHCVIPHYDTDGHVRRYLEARLCDAALAVECGKPVQGHVKLRSTYDGVSGADVVVVIIIAVLAYTYFLLRRQSRRRSSNRLPTVWRKKSH